jgi:hypothetical protein
MVLIHITLRYVEAQCSLDLGSRFAAGKWRNCPSLANSRDLGAEAHKDLLYREALYQGTGFSRADGSGEESGLQPLRTQKELSGYWGEPLQPARRGRACPARRLSEKQAGI